MAERRIDVLQVRWYVRRDRADTIVPRWLAAARAHLPEAVPRRFGATEPLRGRHERDGDEGVARAYAEAAGTLFLQGEPPVHHGALGTPAGLAAIRYGPVTSHGLGVEAEPDDARVRGFVLALADADTLYVSASVDHDVLLERRTLVHDRPSTSEPYLAPLGTWLGLPPTPPRWCWFGPAYVPLVRRHVRAEAAGVGLLWTGGPWVPEPLQARLDEIDPVRRPARKMPRDLRRSPWRALFGG